MDQLLYLTTFSADGEERVLEGQAILRPNGSFEGIAIYPGTESYVNMYIRGDVNNKDRTIYLERFCPEENPETSEQSFYFFDDETQTYLGEVEDQGVIFNSILAVNRLEEEKEILAARKHELEVLIKNYKATYHERFQPEVQELQSITTQSKRFEQEKVLRKERKINYYL